MPEAGGETQSVASGGRSMVPAAIVLAGIIIAAAVLYTGGVGSRLAGGGAPPLPPSPSADTASVIDVVKIQDDDPTLGSPEAPVVIVEFSDFECPFCRQFWVASLSQIKERYVKTGQVRLVYRDFPLDAIHPNARGAAEASECADEQGKFWEYHDRLFQGQASLSPENFKLWAAEAALNMEQFVSCVDSRKYREEVQADFEAGQAAGVSGTPTFYINGKQVVGALPFSEFEKIIEAELANVNP